LDHLSAVREPEAGVRARSRLAPGGPRNSDTDLRRRHQSIPARGKSMRRAVLAAVVLTAACGPKRPPPSFAPDPGLVEQIRELRMSTSTRACPGESFGAVYTAVLKDGSLVPCESRYDKDHPPRLHVIFLERSSPEATPLEGGGCNVFHDTAAT